MTREIILKPSIFSKFSGVAAGTSTMLGNNGSPYHNNLSYWVGDDKNLVRRNRDDFFGMMNVPQERIAFPQQIHSDHIEIIDKPGYYKDTDGLITVEKNLYLIVSTADCYPVLIYSDNKKAVGAIHSGWRGTQKNIVSKALKKMKNELGCNSQDIYVYMGAGISCDNFEVGKEVAYIFDDKYVSKKEVSYFLDLKRCILDQIRSEGIEMENIEISDLCTFDEENYLHSFRRDKEYSGRMFSVIGMVN